MSPFFFALGTEAAGPFERFVLLFRVIWCLVPGDDDVTSISMQFLCLRITCFNTMKAKGNEAWCKVGRPLCMQENNFTIGLWKIGCWLQTGFKRLGINLEFWHNCEEFYSFMFGGYI
jgi:hypothetical protein